MSKIFCFFLFPVILLTGCNSPMFKEMYLGKEKNDKAEKSQKKYESNKYSSKKNVDMMSDSELNNRERQYLKDQHRSMDSTRNERRRKVFGGWAPSKKKD